MQPCTRRSQLRPGASVRRWHWTRHQFCLLLFSLFVGSGVARAATFTVTNTGDSGAGSLRQAISDANGTAGADLIDFNIASVSKTITAATALPPIIETVTIDATTQPGFSGAPIVELTAGPGAQPPNYFDGGLVIIADNCIIRGLVINRFPAGITINGTSGHLLAQGNHVEGCYIGTDISGATQPGVGNGNGIRLSDDGFTPGSGATNNVIGGTTAAARNVISGNSDFGLTMGGNTTTGNIVEGNFIGLNAAGTAAAANGRFGVAIFCAGNTIGGTTAGARNVISGNPEIGVWLGSLGSTNNVVEGNYIGTDVNGTAAIGNGRGIVISDDSVNPGTGASNNTIGGTTPGAGNVISGNTGDGILISDSHATGNTVQGNFIGLNAAGTAAVANANDGIRITAPGSQIGGTAGGAGNVISGNFFNGIDLGSGATNTVIEGNFLGTDFNGTAAVGNGGSGVQIADTNSNRVGGNTAAARNIISGNASFGVRILGSLATGNVVQGNYIGTQSTGLIPLSNPVGVQIESASNNTIGGSGAGQGNIIAGNAGDGIAIVINPSGTATGNQVWGNRIGLDAGGDTMANGSDGVFLGGLVSGNTIGGITSGDGNFISGNLGNGVEILDSQNVVQGNFIGTDITGTLARPNGISGVTVANSNNTIGGTGTGEANIIAFNNSDGVTVSGGTGTAIRGNSIFSNSGSGIDLGADGPTANDVGDADTGPNNLQNFPVLTRVLHFNNLTVISGTIDTTANSTVQVDVYANSGTGAQDGKTYLGSTAVTTDGSGAGTFQISSSIAVPIGNEVTATATDAGGSTSEFGPPVAVTVTQSIGGYIRTSSLAPVANVSVALSPVPGGVTSPVLTDSNGFYLFTDVPDGNYTLTPSNAGWNFTPGTLSLRVSGASRGANFLATRTAPTFSISGRIANSAGVGMAGVVVTLDTTPDGALSPVVSNSAGYYQFRELPAGTYTVTPQLSGYLLTPASHSVTLTNANVGGQNFLAGTRISGRVFDRNGAGLAVATVTLDSFGPAITGVQNPVTTNAAGYYAFNGVPLGSYTVTPSLSGFSFTPPSRSVDVTVAAGPDIAGQDFTGAGGVNVSGRIFTSGGIGISGVTVQVDSGQTAVTNSAGYYVVHNVPNGTRVLTPSKSGLTFTPPNRTIAVNNADINGQNFIGG